MLDFFSSLFDATGFPARWHCGVWSSELGWLHILSDIAIFGAYVAIPCVLAFFALRRNDLPFPRIIWLFVAFIFACGTTHLIEAIIFWHPVYRLAGVVKLFTAIVSWGTVFALIRIVPQVLHLPGLAKLNTELREEVTERTRIETALRQSEEKLASLLTSERQARAEAERASQIKDEFLSTVSHELRSPLNAILGYAQLLGRSPSDEDSRDGLAVIERNAKAQAQIIDDLLDMSRIIAGKLRLNVANVDLTEVVATAIENIHPAADAKQQHIHAVLDPQAAHVLGDAGRLQQIAWNLLSNAVKFTPKGGRIQVALSRVNSHIEFKVSDTGEGIPHESLPLIFGRFQQADSSTTRRHGGLGLGLAIVKQLVELHGGQINAHSDGPGRGASFLVTLPVRATHAASTDGADDGASSNNFGLAANISLAGVRVLVVDDEYDSREIVRRLLNELDATVEVAASANEALAALRRSPPDVLLSDIGMPGTDGYDLVHEIRNLPEAQGGCIPAAALTAFARPEDRQRALLAGFQSHITKPVDPGELAIVVATLAGRTGRRAAET
jgi:signal transduction histidine kinase/ActR/RegA family two-component response regulator